MSETSYTKRRRATPSSSDGATDRRVGRESLLPPTAALSWTQFEDFTERLLSAHRCCPEPLRHVVRIERWGRPGDKQDGIDFEGTFSDGTSAVWQCKRQRGLTPAQVEKAVRACTFEADEYYLVYSGLASAPARRKVAEFPGWEILDQRGLGRYLEDLPLHRRRDVLDATWGVAARKQLLEVPGEDAFLSLDAFAEERLKPATVLNDLGVRVGRETELGRLQDILDERDNRSTVVLVQGPGGRGKTRLLVEALRRFEEAHPQIPVLILSPGRTLDGDAFAELPHTPAVIVVDDAHRDLAAVRPLLHYAQRTTGTQLVLASRPEGVVALRGRIADTGHPLSDIAEIEVGELRRGEARRMVGALTEGLGMTGAARGYLVGQAVHSPHVAVVAANLVRRGELTMPIVVDDGLRRQVLARYEELVTSDVDGVPTETVRTLLAVYAALGPVDDFVLRPVMAEFCALRLVALLRLREALLDRGVLVHRNGMTRVVPDVLADDILEREAAIGADSTGFTEELWTTFARHSRERLVVSLAELDWRLTRRGGPSVIEPVLEFVRSQVRDADDEELHTTMRGLHGLSFTQPRVFIDVLEETRRRLQRRAAPGGEVPVRPRHLPLRHWARTRPNADDVLRALPESYGQCALSAPELLETALDALWSLGRRDARPVSQHSDHAVQVITRRLANLAEIPDSSFPRRIISAVERWLTEPAASGDVTTPLAVLRPLLKKDVERHEIEGRRLLLQSLRVEPGRVRATRDAVRTLLVQQACGPDPRRAAAAIDLLGEALRRPLGGFGRTVEREEILAWRDDDLETVAALNRVVQHTGSPVVRRLVRDAVAWSAEYATSLRLRHAALTLLSALDEYEDDLHELLMSTTSRTIASRRGRAVPTLDQLRRAEATRADRKSDLSGAEQTAGRVERRQEYRDQLVVRVVEELASIADPAAVVTTIGEACQEILAVVPATHLPFWEIGRALAVVRPEWIEPVVRIVADGPAGPVDGLLEHLLPLWADHDERGLLSWLDTWAAHRVETRSAVAVAANRYGWTDRGEPFSVLRRQGLHDEDPRVRDEFLAGSHPLLVADPVATVAELLAQGISPQAAGHVLDLAANFDGESWGRTLTRASAAAVLGLANRAGLEEWSVQQVVVGIAWTHPEMVLDHLLATQKASLLPADVDGLPAVFEAHPLPLVRWMIEKGADTEPVSVGAVVAVAVGSGLTAEQAVQLETAVDRLGPREVVALAVQLGDLSLWPVHQPDLARRLIVRAREYGREDVYKPTRAVVGTAMRLVSWGWTNGHSSELTRAHALASACADTEPDPDLAEDYRQARDEASAHLAELRKEMEDE